MLLLLVYLLIPTALAEAANTGLNTKKPQLSSKSDSYYGSLALSDKVFPGGTNRLRRTQTVQEAYIWIQISPVYGPYGGPVGFTIMEDATRNFLRWNLAGFAHLDSTDSIIITALDFEVVPNDNIGDIDDEESSPSMKLLADIHVSGPWENGSGDDFQAAIINEINKNLDDGSGFPKYAIKLQNSERLYSDGLNMTRIGYFNFVKTIVAFAHPITSSPTTDSPTSQKGVDESKVNNGNKTRDDETKLVRSVLFVIVGLVCLIGLFTLLWFSGKQIRCNSKSLSLSKTVDEDSCYDRDEEESCSNVSLPEQQKSATSPTKELEEIIPSTSNTIIKDSFQVGNTVRIRDLKKSSHLNGLFGIIKKSADPDSGRLVVDIGREVLRINPSNLSAIIIKDTTGAAAEIGHTAQEQ